MLKDIIDIGLTVLNAAQLINNNARDERSKEERRKQRETNKTISDVRNAAYIARRLLK